MSTGLVAYGPESENDDDAMSTISSDEGSVDWWNEPESFVERANEAGDQLIPEPETTPLPPGDAHAATRRAAGVNFG